MLYFTVALEFLYHFYMMILHYFAGRVEAVAKTRLFIVSCRVSRTQLDLQYIMTICQLEMVLESSFK